MDFGHKWIAVDVERTGANECTASWNTCFTFSSLDFFFFLQRLNRTQGPSTSYSSSHVDSCGVGGCCCCIGTSGRSMVLGVLEMPLLNTSPCMNVRNLLSTGQTCSFIERGDEKVEDE